MDTPFAICPGNPEISFPWPGKTTGMITGSIRVPAGFRPGSFRVRTILHRTGSILNAGTRNLSPVNLHIRVLYGFFIFYGQFSPRLWKKGCFHCAVSAAKRSISCGIRSLEKILNYSPGYFAPFPGDILIFAYRQGAMIWCRHGSNARAVYSPGVICHQSYVQSDQNQRESGGFTLPALILIWIIITGIRD